MAKAKKEELKEEDKKEEEVLEEETSEEEVSEEAVEEEAAEEEAASEEEAEEESEGEDEAEEAEEKPEEETSEKEDEAEEKQLRSEIVKEISDEVTKSVTASITKSVASKISKKKQATKANKVKKEKMSGDIKHVEKMVKIHHNSKGETIEMEKSNVETLAKWFGAIATKHHSNAEKFYDQLETKLEPMVVGTNADGGFLVPTILTDILIDIANDAAVIRPRATIIDLSGPGATFAFNQVVGRPQVSWTGENVSKSTTSLTLNQGSLTPYKLSAIQGVSLELLQDSATAVIPLLTRQFAEAIAREEDRAFMVGTGAAQPTGIDTAANVPTVDANFSLDYGDFLDVYYRLPQSYRESGRAVWIMNGRTISASLGILDSNNRPIFDSNGANDVVTNKPVQRILGAPVLEQNNLASSKIFFGDLSAYYIGDKMKMTVDTTTEATVASTSAWENNLTFVRVEERVDGELLDSRAFVEMTNTGIS